MSTDRELLELAAKAAGIVGLTWRNGSQCFYFDDLETGREIWYPLQRDGQALRLAAALEMHIAIGKLSAIISVAGGKRRQLFTVGVEMRNDETHAAMVRRAIVRAAAEIGKVTP